MEKRELFQIGEVARLFHLSVGALRHYEKEGLLKPEYVDEETGYRYYSTRQFECLNTIRYLRALDMSLPQIAGFLENRDVDKMREMLCQQKEAVARRQRELQIIERKLERRLRQLDDALASEFDVVRLIRTEPLRIAWLRRELSISSYLDLETSIRKLEEKQQGTAAFLGKVGVGIGQEQLLRRQYDRYQLVFLILEQEDVYEGETEELPEQLCVSLRFHGGHGEAPAYYRRLASFMEERGLAAAGFSREITMIDYGLTSDVSRFVTEIQIPVEEGNKK